MGSRFEFVVVDSLEDAAQANIQLAINEVIRIEKLISSWDSASQTSAINRQAGKGFVKVDWELFSLIERSQRISKLTQGAFDISFGSIDDALWHFDKNTKQLPDSATAMASVRNIDYQNILLNMADTAVMLKNKGMKIGFGAIGKGYAAEMAKALLQRNGVQNGIVNAGGDLTVWGQQPDGSDWTIGIANPNFKNKSFSWLSIKNMAVVTSGNYEKFFEIDGIRYSHIIDPRTGFPTHGLKSVTIICPNAELADALATSVFVMGQEVGIDLIEQLKGIECILVTDDNQITNTSGIKLQAK